MAKTSSQSKRPTEEIEEEWIYAWNITSYNNREPEDNCGKWLIFEPSDKIDDVWAKINLETEMGGLGFASKVSTMKDKEERDSLHGEGFVICVYSYDYTDKADVMRVRRRLRELGFTRQLCYKTDAATLAGQYTYNTSGGVSLYRA